METIIVQDTDKTVLEMLTTALEMANFIVCPVMDFDEDFLGLIDRVRPHVVILDYRLTGYRCLEVLRNIKVKYPNLPVIATSCNSNIHQVYNKLGFDGYIEKPFDLDLLYRVLRKYIPEPKSK
jgi:two-component system nitrogen regulation response regulator GlnG